VLSRRDERARDCWISIRAVATLRRRESQPGCSILPLVASVNDALEIPLPPDTVLDLCRQVVKERRWFVDEVGPTHISARMTERNPLKPPPIVIRIDLGAANGLTRVNLTASWPRRVGPFVRRSLSKYLAAFRETLEFEARRERT
jgi:hypothetical protein